MHVDTAYPCSMQVAGQWNEGGWSFDYDEDDINPWTDSQCYCALFAVEETVMHSREVSSIGWNQ